jgi:hypothetical protein
MEEAEVEHHSFLDDQDITIQGMEQPLLLPQGAPES